MMRGSKEEKRSSRKWFRQLADGKTDALSKIYDTFSARLYGHSLWMLRNKQDAEDVLQDTMLKLAQMGASLLKVRNPSTYLFTMVHREAVDIIRQSRRYKVKEEQEMETFAHEEPNPAEYLNTEKLGHAISTLKIGQREVLYLHLYQDLTFRQIGKIMGISTFTAASRYRLAIAQLRKVFGE